MASFIKIAPKNWSFRYKYKDSITGKRREIKRQGYATKPEAEAAYEEANRSIQVGFDVSNDEKLIEYLNFWLREYKEGKVAKNTYRIHERNIKNHIVPYFQSIKLEDLTYKLYQKFINSLIKQEYSIRTIEIVHGTMYGAMQKAKIHKKIHSNPCENVTIYSTKEKKEKKHKKSTIKFIPYE